MAVKLSKLQLVSALDMLSKAGIAVPEQKTDEAAYLQAVIDGLCRLADGAGLGVAEHVHDQLGFENRLAKEIDRIARTGDISLLLMWEMSLPEEGGKAQILPRVELAKDLATLMRAEMQTQDAIGVRDDGRVSMLLTNCSPEEAEAATQGLCKMIDQAAASVFGAAGLPSQTFSFACGGAYVSQWSELSHETLAERALGQLAEAVARGEKGSISLETPPVCEVSAEEKALLFSLSGSDDITMGDSLDSSGQ